MSGRPWPTPRLIVLLFLGLRLGALVLYRPGGYVAVAPPYPNLPAWLDARVAALATTELSRQLLVGVLLLPFEVATLVLLYRLARLRWSEARARRSALFWALLWLPMSAWLRGVEPVGVPVLLGLLLLMGTPSRGELAPRHWLWPALTLTLLAAISGGRVSATLYLLPFIALLLPTVRGALMAVSLIFLDALAHTLAPALLPSSPVVVVAALALAAAALLLAWEWVHLLQPRRVRRLARPGLALGIIATALLLTAPVALRDYRAARLARLPLAPLVVEWSQAPPGTILLDDWDLYDQLYAWSGRRHELWVVTEQNREMLEARLSETSSPIWVLARREAPNSGFTALRKWVASRGVTGETSVINGVTVERYVR